MKRCSTSSIIRKIQIKTRRYYCIPTAAAAAAESLQSCLTLCDPIDGSPPGSPVPGILQARTLEWVAIAFSSVWKWKVKVKLLSPVRLLATPWTAAHQAPPSTGFSRQENWSGVPLPSLVYLLEWPKSRILTIPNTGEDVQQKELSLFAHKNAKWYSNSGSQTGGFLQN